MLPKTREIKSVKPNTLSLSVLGGMIKTDHGGIIVLLLSGAASPLGKRI